MREILIELNEHAGVKGSLVVTEDGMVVASALGKGLEQETLAAVSSMMIQTAKKCLDANLDRIIMTSSHGKLVLEDLGNAYIVVVTNSYINLDVTLIEIQSAGRKIRARERKLEQPPLQG